MKQCRYPIPCLGFQQPHRETRTECASDHRSSLMRAPGEATARARLRGSEESPVVPLPLQHAPLEEAGWQQFLAERLRPRPAAKLAPPHDWLPPVRHGPPPLFRAPPRRRSSPREPPQQQEATSCSPLVEPELFSLGRRPCERASKEHAFANRHAPLNPKPSPAQHSSRPPAKVAGWDRNPPASIVSNPILSRAE